MQVDNSKASLHQAIHRVNYSQCHIPVISNKIESGGFTIFPFCLIASHVQTKTEQSTRKLNNNQEKKHDQAHQLTINHLKIH